MAKSFNLNRAVFAKALKLLREEAEKCHLLCANCHREVHAYNDTRFLVIQPGIDDADTIYEARSIGFET